MRWGVGNVMTINNHTERLGHCKLRNLYLTGHLGLDSHWEQGVHEGAL